MVTIATAVNIDASREENKHTKKKYTCLIDKFSWIVSVPSIKVEIIL